MAVKEQNIEEWAEKIIALRKYSEDGSTEMYLRSFRQEFGKQLLRELLAEREQSSEIDRMLSETLPVDLIVRVFASHDITLED